MRNEIPYAILAVVIVIIGYIVSANSGTFDYRYAAVDDLKATYKDIGVINDADVIVRGKITSGTERQVVLSVPDEDAGDNYIEKTYTIVGLEIADIVHGDIDSNSELLFKGDVPVYVEADKEYLFFLSKSSLRDGSYYMTGCRDGAYEIDGNKLENKETDTSFALDRILDQIENLK